VATKVCHPAQVIVAAFAVAVAVATGLLRLPSLGRGRGATADRNQSHPGVLVVPKFRTSRPSLLMLGHASAAMTLDIYAGLFADDLDAVADRLDGRS
jgi:hypothetical protein